MAQFDGILFLIVSRCTKFVLECKKTVSSTNNNNFQKIMANSLYWNLHDNRWNRNADLE